MSKRKDLMHISDDVKFSDEGKIIDYLSDKELVDTPEERVRQRFIKILQTDYGYPKSDMLREVPIQSGSKILKDRNGNDIRADIVIYNNKKAGGKTIFLSLRGPFKGRGNHFFPVIPA